MKKIIHVDMDCFYAAVETRDRPELRGKPVAVGGSPNGRGVVATANYEARKFGVHSAQSSSRAVKLCPGLILVRPDFSKYKAESRKVRAIFHEFTDLVEPLSLDEAYLDVTHSPVCGGIATQMARVIRRRIFEETGLTASAGVAPNKFLAKIASEWNKPDGLKVIRPQEIAGIMPSLPVDKILGVGRVTATRMREMGLVTCGDLQKLSVQELTARFGTWGASLFDYARGIDHRSVRTSWERKSLSVENTFRTDLVDLEACLNELPELYESWGKRAERAEITGQIRSAVVKLKFHDFRQTTREVSLTEWPTLTVFEKLLREAFQRQATSVRLIGIGVRLADNNPKRAKGPQLSFDIES